MRTRSPYASQLSLLVQGRRYVLAIDIELLLHMDEIVCDLCGNFWTNMNESGYVARHGKHQT